MNKNTPDLSNDDGRRRGRDRLRAAALIDTGRQEDDG